MEINLFFLRKRSYECIVTSKDEISTPYDRKITIELESAKKWEEGTLCGASASVAIEKSILIDRYNDDEYYFINALKWLFNSSSRIPRTVFLALEKEIADSGNEYYTKNLEITLNGSFNSFLFPRE